jgi:predicted DNA-binding protein
MDEITDTPVKRGPGRPRKLDKMTQDNFALSPVLRESLQAASDKTGRPKAAIVREALVKYLALETV